MSIGKQYYKKIGVFICLKFAIMLYRGTLFNKGLCVSQITTQKASVFNSVLV